MAVPRKPVESFVKAANSDAPAPKSKREKKPTDMELIGFRVHRDIAYTLERYAEKHRKTYAEFLRDLLVTAMQAKGIEVEVCPIEAVRIPQEQD